MLASILEWFSLIFKRLLIVCGTLAFCSSCNMMVSKGLLFAGSGALSLVVDNVLQFVALFPRLLALTQVSRKGQILSPLLFLVFMNDISHASPTASVNLFVTLRFSFRLRLQQLSSHVCKRLYLTSVLG